MNTPLFRWLKILVASFSFGITTLLAYLALTSPHLPYNKANLYQIDKLIEARAGALQSGDEILTFNGRRFYGCMYFLESPIYWAPLNTPLPVEYRRPATGETGLTTIVLQAPSARVMFDRSFVFLTAFSFVLIGMIILLGGVRDGPPLLVGVIALSHGVLVASGPEIGDFQAPLSIFFWLNVPFWSVMIVITHSVWPINQLHRRPVRVLVGVASVASVTHLVSHLAGADWFGCFPNQFLLNVAWWSYPLNIILPFPAVLYLLRTAYQRTDNPFSRLKIRAIAWSFILGFGSPLLLSFLPPYLKLPWVAPIEITLMLSGIVPLTYLFAIYRGELLYVDRYLNRTLFTVLFFVFWLVVTFVIVKGLLHWISDPDPRLVAILAALPPLLAATFVRERLGLLIDLALYGIHYDYETVVSQIGLALAGVLSEEGLADVAVRQLPQALSIRQAALWLVDKDDQLNLVGHSTLPAGLLQSIVFSPSTIISNRVRPEGAYRSRKTRGLAASPAGASPQAGAAGSPPGPVTLPLFRRALQFVWQLPAAPGETAGDAERALTLPANQAAGPVRLAAEVSSSESEVEVLRQPLYVEGDPCPWQVIVYLYVRERLAGLVLFGPKVRERAYSERDIRTLDTLANWMSTTVANIQYLAGQREVAERERRLMLTLVENEEHIRADVASELHDRGISALGLVRLMVKQERSNAVIMAGLERVIADLRELSHNRLSPIGLDQGLAQALEGMVASQRLMDLPVTLHVEPSYAQGEPLSPVVSRELFYIAQEAVVNALKHAQASEVRVTLARQDGQLQLTVCDDGRSFDAEAMLVGREHRGLGILQARVTRLGGTLTIKSVPEHGSEITVAVKLDNADAADR